MVGYARLKQISSSLVRSFKAGAVMLLVVSLFSIVIFAFFFNVLLAQFNCAYSGICQDMGGYARLKQISIIIGTLL